MNGDISHVTGEEWAQRIAELSEGDRARRLEAVDALLAAPDDLCSLLESELRILREQLTSSALGPAPQREATCHRRRAGAGEIPRVVPKD